MARRPRYCGPHNPRGTGYIWVGKRPHYFPGKHGSLESLRAYEDWCRDNIDQPKAPPKGATVARLAADFIAAEKPSNIDNFKSIIRLLIVDHAATKVDDFGPLACQHVRQQMIDEGWCRTHINEQVKRLRRMFKWGVSRELVKPETLVALRTIEGLRKGRTAARESAPVKPVDMVDVEATIAHVSPIIGAMIRLQAMTGMRSANICQMRRRDVSMDDDVWRYVPPEHKNDWRGHSLTVFLGPRARAAIFPLIWLKSDDEPLFSPLDVVAMVAMVRDGKRKTKRYGRRKARKPSVSRRVREAYDAGSYRQAIRRGCVAAQVSVWTPRQLRHTVATAVRERFGLEGAQVYLGHATADATQIYAERDLRLARRIADEVG